MVTFTKIKRSKRRRSDNMLLFINTARKAGMPLSKTPISGPGQRAIHWDGTDCAYKGESLSNALHELAHWMVASPEHRGLPNFGLGRSPSDNLSRNDATKHNLMVCESSDAEEQESYASVLGIIYEYNLGLDAADTLRNHGWDSSSECEFTSIITKLVERGLITTQGKAILS